MEVLSPGNPAGAKHPPRWLYFITPLLILTMLQTLSRRLRLAVLGR